MNGLLAMTEVNHSHVLAECRKAIRSIISTPGIGATPGASKTVDDALQRLGQDVLGEKVAPIGNSTAQVFIASDIYINGGHTAVIGDFVAALVGAQKVQRADCHLILTYINREECESSKKEAIIRTGVPFENVHAISAGHDAASLLKTLETLLLLLKKIKAQRGFLFHHPEDVVACAAALPDLAGQWCLVHHNDSVPSLGLHLPQIRLIDLSPRAAAFSRALGVSPSLLNLTLAEPDKHKHTRSFLKEGRLFTASAGSASKFHGDYPIQYTEVVAQTLKATGGRHLHIGPLDAETLQQIHTAIIKAGAHLSQWLHIPHVKSVAQTLTDENVDLFMVSVPVPGLRTTVEVMASATPCLWHSINPEDDIWCCQTKPEGAWLWRNLEHLDKILNQLTTLDALAEQSRICRAHYEAHHHPDVFSKHLHGILAHGVGAEDNQRILRDQWAVQRLAQVTAGNDHLVLCDTPEVQSNGWFSRFKQRFFCSLFQ